MNNKGNVMGRSQTRYETLKQIEVIVANMRDAGIRPTLTNIAKELGVTKQSVEATLRKCDAKHLTFTGENKAIIQALKAMDISNMTHAEIQALPIDGIKHITLDQLRHLLSTHQIASLGRYRSIYDRLRCIDTSQYNMEQLRVMVGNVSLCRVREVIAEHNMPYKKQGGIKFNGEKKKRQSSD
ncbi:hypothetical protein NLY09_09045 (plasmid) [Burkholderia vietnamiensis]